MDARMTALHNRLKDFKKSDAYVKWNRYAKACEHYMGIHPNKYRMRFHADEGNYSFAELVLVKYRISNTFNILRKQYSLGYFDFSDKGDKLDE